MSNDAKENASYDGGCNLLKNCNLWSLHVRVKEYSGRFNPIRKAGGQRFDPPCSTNLVPLSPRDRSGTYCGARGRTVSAAAVDLLDNRCLRFMRRKRG
jgi:hypothetical protein